MWAGHTGTTDGVCGGSSPDPGTGDVDTWGEYVYACSVIGEICSLVVDIGGANSDSLL